MFGIVVSPIFYCVFHYLQRIVFICMFVFQKDPRDTVKYDRISELLIESGADVNLVNAHDTTVLHEVAQYGRVFAI